MFDLATGCTIVVVQPPKETSTLGPREKECLEFIAVGFRPAEIADRLSISRRTVESYLESAKRKLGAKNRDQAVVIGIRSGIINP